MTAALERISTTPTLSAPADPAAQRPEPLSDFDVIAVSTAVAVLGVLGLVNSFANVTAALRPAFGVLAPTATLGIDLGIAVFEALHLLLARLNMPIPWLRLVPWALTGATIALNVAPEHSWVGRLAHACLPLLWVVAVEVGVHAIRVATGLATGRRMDSIRTSRWLLAPVRTFGLWRRMVLWEIRSYPDALAAERARVLALTDLKDRYGHLRLGRRKVRAPWAWRWTAPRKERALHRLGEHAPITAHPAPSSPPLAPQPAAQPARPATNPAPRKARSGLSTAEAITHLRAAEPDIGTAEIAIRLGVSTRTVRRHLATTTTTSSSDRSERR
jgi:DNA-binding CsgD family transcriptional regulator